MWTLPAQETPYLASSTRVDAAPLLARRPTPGAFCAWLVGFIASVSLHATAFATDIRVFTDRAHPVHADADTPVILLDAPPRILAALSAKLPADPQRATELVSARLKQGGPALQHDLAAAYQGVIEAWGLGIAKVPAVVVDHRFVVYGEADVARALSWIETYRRAHP